MKSNRRSSWLQGTGLARNSAALMLLAILGTSRVWAGNNVWTSIGPFGGSIQALAIDPQSPATLYAGGGGGVFKTTNGGASWTGLPAGFSARILAIDLQSPKTVYAACGAWHCGMFKSSDGGAHWSPINSGLDSVIVVDSLAVDPQNPGTVYVGASACFQASGSPGFVSGGENFCWRPGIFKTTDGGASWTGSGFSPPRTSVDNGSVNALAVDPRNPSRVYAATTGGVYRSTDGGANWTKSALPRASALVVDPQNTSTIYAVMVYGGIFKTTDGGASWIEASTVGLPADCCGYLAIDPRNPATMYAGGPYSVSVYRTTDGGAHWSAAASVPAVNAAVSVNLGNPGVMGLVVDPQNPGTVYAATGSQGIVKSTDQANSWSMVNSGLSAAPVYSVAIDSQNPGTIYAGSSYRLFKTTDGGANWSAGVPTNAGLNSIAIDPQAPSTLYAAASGPWGSYSTCDDCDTVPWPTGVFKSVDGGARWISIGPGLEPGTFTASLAIDPHDPRTIYAGGFSPNRASGFISEILKSVDGGASWKTAGSFPSWVRAVVIDSQAPGTLYAVAVDRIFKSTDGSTSWKDLQVPGGAGNCEECLGFGVLAIDPQRPDTLYAGGYAGVSKSTDGGASWKVMSSGLPLPPMSFTGVNALAVDPHDSNIAYATIEGRVFRSADGAATWSEVNAGITVTGARTLTFDPASSGTVYAGTASGGIFAITFVP